MKKQFHISDVLSVTTGRLVSTRHMAGIYEILNHMTNDQLFTHQLPRASAECKPWLIRQYPQLADVDGGALDAWFERQEQVQANQAYGKCEAAWREAAARYHASGRAEREKEIMHEAARRQDEAREKRNAVATRLVALWLESQIKEFGEFLNVEPIPADDHARRDAVEELESMVGKERVIVIDAEP